MNKTGSNQKDHVKKHLDMLAKDYDQWKKKNTYFYSNLERYVKRNIIPGSRVLEIGCRTGDMLAASEASYGVGLDISPEIVKIAAKKHPKYIFKCSSPDQLDPNEKFDYVILLNILGYVNDIASLFDDVYKVCHPKTKILVTTVNPWWDSILTLFEKLKMKIPSAPHNFIEKANLTKMIDSSDYTISYTGYMTLCPKFVPVLSFLANTIGVRVWGVRLLSILQYMILKPKPENKTDLGYGCTVVIPCCNEEDNIEEAVRRVPKMGKNTEIIVVNDGSTDGTAGVVSSLEKEIPGLRLIDYSPNRGKGYAVEQGFNAASEEVMMILDADMTVIPEELPRFFNLLNKGVCRFVNGTRMIYPMQEKAMKKLNLLGNNVFGAVMTFLTGQRLTDTLCGTKALYKRDYKRIRMGVDKWGDFDLLFGAAKNGDKIMEVPVHYMSRKAGKSKMKTLSHGIHLTKVCIRGFKELVLGLQK